MKNNQKFLSGFLLGAAAGAIVTVFLQGEKGQQLVKTAKSGIKDAAEDLKDGIENIDNTLDKWIKKGRSLVAELKNKNTSEDIYDYEEIFS